jgi:predicted nucleic-acid-binding protein
LIGLDTNVVIRYLVQDDAKQSALATVFIERTLSTDNPGLLTHIVLCEIAWVLEGSYGLSSARIADIMERLFSAKQIALEDAQLAWQALRTLRERAVDFSDALIGAIARKCGCEHTVTFDKQAAKLGSFKLLPV